MQNHIVNSDTLTHGFEMLFPLPVLESKDKKKCCKKYKKGKRCKNCPKKT
jgi:hypothetical protein